MPKPTMRVSSPATTWRFLGTSLTPVISPLKTYIEDFEGLNSTVVLGVISAHEPPSKPSCRKEVALSENPEVQAPNPKP